MVCTLGLSILYVYVFREYCFYLILYSGSVQGVVEHVINVRYYYYYNGHCALNIFFYSVAFDLIRNYTVHMHLQMTAKHKVSTLYKVCQSIQFVQNWS